MPYDYQFLDVQLNGRLATVTISNPPINIITVDLYRELLALSIELKADPNPTVVVFKSADPDFFLAHFDVEAILQRPIDMPAEQDGEMKEYHAMCERYRTMDKVIIGQIEGRVGGGGSELAANFDMRYGVRGKTKICQMEVPLGILPGGTGTQRLPRLIGLGRAMEVVLAGEDLDAETAERWGYLNRLYEASDIDQKVQALASRIASFPPEAVRLAKASVHGSELPLVDGLRNEAYLFQRLLRTDGAQRNMRRFLEIGGQTREGELRVGALGGELGEPASGGETDSGNNS